MHIEKEITVKIKANGCYEAITKSLRKGYPTLNIGGKTVSAHRHVYAKTHNVVLHPTVIIKHRCDNRLCINPAHLEAGTKQENNQEAWDRGRREPRRYTRLAPDVVRAIRREPRSVSHATVAEKYGVSRPSVIDIRKFKTYQDVV